MRHLLLEATFLKAGFHFGEIGRATKRWEYQGHAQLEIQAESERFTGERGVSSGS